MHRSLVLTSALAALAIPLVGAGPVMAEPMAKIDICHFPGHVDPTDPGQIDFILDVDLDPVDAVAECTGLNGKVLSVHPNAVSYADDASAHGHVVDPEGRPQR